MKNLWRKMDGPLKIGFVFGLAGIVLTIIGVLRDPGVPVTAWSLGIGSLIAGGTWGVISWVIATAASDVEQDVQRAQAETHSSTELSEHPNEST